jgi:hypothetical protein
MATPEAGHSALGPVVNSMIDCQHVCKKQASQWRSRTCSLDPPLSRNALGSGATAWASRPCNELSELFTLPLGVDVFVCGWGPGRGPSFSRGGPLSDAGWGPLGPCDDVISRVAAGSGLPCCLLFLPNRNDMAPASQPWGRYNGSGCRLHTHSVCTEAGKRVEWVEWSSCGRDTSSEARDWGAGWRARALASRYYGRSAGVMRMSKERKAGAGAVQDAKCRSPGWLWRVQGQRNFWTVLMSGLHSTWRGRRRDSSSSSSSSRETWTAHQRPARDLT